MSKVPSHSPEQFRDRLPEGEGFRTDDKMNDKIKYGTDSKSPLRDLGVKRAGR